MILMLGDIPRLLDLIWSWIAPSEDDQDVFRSCNGRQKQCSLNIVDLSIDFSLYWFTAHSRISLTHVTKILNTKKN